MNFQTPGLRAELEDRKGRSVVDEQRRQTPRLDVVARKSRLGDDQTHHQLHGGHFERKERHALLVVDGHVAGHREHEGSLTHRGTRGDDDQVGQLPAQRHAVQSQDVLGRLHRTFDVPLGDLEDLAFGVTDQLRDVGRLVVGAFLNLGRRADQLALHVFLGDDLGVKLDVGRRTDLLGQLREVRSAAHLLQLLLGLEPLGHGIEVDGFQLHRQFVDRLVDQAVFLGVERLGGDELLHGDDAVLFEHQRTEHGLLQLDRLRGYVADGIGHRLERLPVAGGGCKIFRHG